MPIRVCSAEDAIAKLGPDVSYGSLTFASAMSDLRPLIPALSRGRQKRIGKRRYFPSRIAL